MATSAGATSVFRPPISASMWLADCGTASTRCASPSAIASTTVSPISAAGRCSTTGVVLLEVFLFDFAGDLYGKPIDVAFIAWICEEKFFGSIDELVQAINEDLRQARATLSRAPNVFPPIRDVFDQTCRFRRSVRDFPAATARRESPTARPG